MYKQIGVLGGGISGIGAAVLAKSRGYAVWVSDEFEIRPEQKEILIMHQIPFEEKGHTFDKLKTCDCVVKSPGIPGDHATVKALRDAGVEVIGEIEWAYRHAHGKVIGITGSNGKTTTTGLCHHFLISAGLDAVKVGNIGKGFCHFLAESEADWYVVELSSFQLEDIVTFRPSVAVLLNITPDHLDRYGYSLDRYADAKMKIAQSMKEDDKLIYNAMDPVTVAKVMSADIETGLWSIRETDLVEGNRVFVRDDLMLDLSRSRLIGRHNQVNVIAAARAALLAGCPDEVLQPALESFVNEPHRMEWVGEHQQVQYINDSKATNVDAVWYALDAIKTPVIWIAGGLDKGNDYAQVMELVQSKVKALVCLGIDNKKLLDTFSTKVDVIKETTTMRGAVMQAASLASPGDTVLLSPACASFDLFYDYKDRGDQFRQEVGRLKEV